MEAVRIKIGHPSPMVGAYWCHPIGWSPANEISNAKFENGAWRNDEGEIAGIVYFTPRDEGEEVEVDVGDLRVAACRKWEILDEVIIDERG
jgi:hypothetical protein